MSEFLFFIKNMSQSYQKIIDSYESMQNELMKQEIASDIQKSIEINKKMNDLKDAYLLAKKYIKYEWQRKEAEDLLNTEKDKDILEMAKEQKKEADEQLSDLENKLKIALLPKDPNDDKNIFLEIRPAAWWDESWLFATELLRMYLNFAQSKWRKTEIVEEQLSDIWWVKFVMLKISWEKVYSIMKFESWVHRVQRIPETESQWRVHTSTVTVAIMPEVKNVEIELNENDIIMDTYWASSAWWQNANKNKTWVRLHHKPTWIIVTIWDSKSQMQNKEKAYQVLKAKIYQIEIDKQNKEQKDLRWNQIWTWDRSEKIRTYNFPQDRVTDHRIKKSWSNIPDILSGNIWHILNDVIIENQSKLLEKYETNINI